MELTVTLLLVQIYSLDYFNGDASSSISASLYEESDDGDNAVVVHGLAGWFP